MEQNLTRCYNIATVHCSLYQYCMQSHVNRILILILLAESDILMNTCPVLSQKCNCAPAPHRTSYAVERCCITPHSMISTSSYTYCAAILGDHNSLDHNPLSTSSSSALVSAVHHVCNLIEMCTAHKNAEMHCLIGNALCLPCKILLTSFVNVNVNKQCRGQQLESPNVCEHGDMSTVRINLLTCRE